MKSGLWVCLVVLFVIVVACDVPPGDVPPGNVTGAGVALRAVAASASGEAAPAPKRPTETEAREVVSTAAERQVTEVEDLPAVIADYVRYAGTDGRTVQERWSFARRGSRVELRRPDERLIETWQRDPKSGRLSRAVLFQDERLAVLYVPGDLKGLGVDPNWYLLTHQFDAPPLDMGLKQGGEVFVPRLAMSAVRYSGTRGRTQLQVHWLPRLQIPALIQAQDEHGNAQSIELTALRRFGEAPDAFTRLRDYEQIDFADLGDDETNPKIIRLRRRLEAVHAFGAYEHGVHAH